MKWQNCDSLLFRLVAINALIVYATLQLFPYQGRFDKWLIAWNEALYLTTRAKWICIPLLNLNLNLSITHTCNCVSQQLTQNGTQWLHIMLHDSNLYTITPDGTYVYCMKSRFLQTFQLTLNVIWQKFTVKSDNVVMCQYYEEFWRKL